MVGRYLGAGLSFVDSSVWILSENGLVTLALVGVRLTLRFVPLLACHNQLTCTIARQLVSAVDIEVLSD
jgi:hypothetical protein